MMATIPNHDPRWLCLYFSRLALDVFDQTAELTSESSTGEDAAVISRPIAVIEQRRVHCANRENLPAGLALATAHALYPDLLALDRKPETEQAYLQQLAHWAYQFTPGVVIADRNSLLLEIGSCRQLYRGTHNLLKKIQRALQQRDQHAEFGFARTPKAAWLLAQCDGKPALHNDCIDDNLLARQLANIPVDLLEIAGESQQALEQMGLTTLGALCDLPSAALGRRFGTVFIDYLQKVIGSIPDPQLFFAPAARFQHGLTFIDGIPSRQMLLFPMKRLLQSLDDYLRARQLLCHTLQWQLFDAHHLQAEFSIELSRTHNRWQSLLELSRIKLDQVALTAAVFSIHLMCEDFFAAAPNAQQLFPDENDEREASAALIDRLQARLGGDALQRIEVQESHWPELAVRSDFKNRPPLRSRGGGSQSETEGSSSNTTPSPYGHSPLGSLGSYEIGGAKKLRPLWLLPQPKPLTHRDNKPFWHSPLTLLRGPERIGNHWWQEEENERDYYIARHAHGVICWIYCERSTRCWFLHGLFA